MNMPRLAVLLIVLQLNLPLFAQDAVQPGSKAPQQVPRSDRDTQATLSAVVQIRMKALPGARSAESLGAQREGTGVAIDGQGHILTIGYVVNEAESIEVTTHENQTVPATLLGYDHATGLSVLRTTVPLAGVTPMELGNANALEINEPVMVLPHGGRGAASIGYVVSKRKFTASWEYLLESALFVSPPTMQWAGAALVNREGRLVGIGSLLLRTVDESQPVPGNLFVPVDALKPILKDLLANGKRTEPARPWLGLGTEELQGHLFVTNVTRDGPAAKAGIRRGDILIGVGKDTVRSQEEFYRRLWSLGSAGTEVPLRLLQGAEVKEVSVHSMDRNQHFQSKPAF